ncbi:Metallo-dependent phosphatase [Xylaria venustula]|nr:Metallo-dependent phosphatase [Xylaria venustula]
MASYTPGRYQRPPNLNLTLIVIAFILSTIFLSYMRLDPTDILALSLPHPISHKPDDSMTTTKGKHDKDQPGRTYPQLSTLPASLLPTPEEASSRRLIILGDVHGHLDAFEALLQKAEFSSSRGDTVILAGDIVNKGPDSAGVVDLAMRIGAYGVRGNHDDRVLRAWEYLEAKKSKKKQKKKKKNNNNNNKHDRTKEVESGSDTDDEEEVDDIINEYESETATTQEEKGEDGQGIQENSTEERSESDADSQSHKKQKKKGKGKKKGKKGKAKKPPPGDLATAKSLKPEHRAWLAALPLILRVGDLGPRYGDVIVVHAGLVPGIPLEDQDPEAVMNMRTLLAPSRTHTTDAEAVRTENEPQSQLDPANQNTEQRENKHNNNNNNNNPMNMIPSPSRDGTPWAKIWTNYQTSSILSRPHTRPTTVVYGHDAKAGLQLRKYTFGLDSGCGSDNALTGMILEIPPAVGSDSDNVDPKIDEEDEGEEGDWEETNTTRVDQEDIQRQHKRSRIRHRLVSVPCAS